MKIHSLCEKIDSFIINKIGWIGYKLMEKPLELSCKYFWNKILTNKKRAGIALKIVLLGNICSVIIIFFGYPFLGIFGHMIFDFLTPPPFSMWTRNGILTDIMKENKIKSLVR